VSEAERTDDGRYLVIGGRRWRASDPAIPDSLRQELVDELMAARRLVRTDPEHARPRVHDAKVALGERGRAWWESRDEGASRDRLAAAIRALLRHRDGSTICPSDAARVAGGEEWRDLMPVSRDVAFDLADEGVVVVTSKGRVVPDREAARGPLRIGPAPG
jgi:hypothetical protein